MARALLAAIAVITFTLSGCMSIHSSNSAPKNLRTVDHLDVKRYLGDWHVIARVPYLLEKENVATTDRYQLRDDGKIDVTFLFRKERFDAPQKEWKGLARVVDKTTNAEWRVQLIWPFRAAYRVLELDPGYQWAIVSSGDGDLIWVLSRARKMDNATYELLVEKVRARGLVADKLVLVPQPAL